MLVLGFKAASCDGVKDTGSIYILIGETTTLRAKTN